MIVHDLRSPLLAVLGYADAIRKGEPDAAAGAAERIATAGRHMLAVVNDLLDLSKLNAEDVRLDYRPVNALRLFTDSLSVVTMAAAAKDLTLTLDCAPDFPLEFPGDPRRLRQILINLLSNAVKFTDQGRIVMSAHVDPASASFCISVTDNGPGLSEAEIATLFQPFRQTGSGERKGGTGLGLAISNRLAHVMGGSIAVRSTPGAGATFTLRLPLCARIAEARGQIPRLRQPVQQACTPGTPTLSNARLAELDCLVVDDDPLVRDLIVTILKRHCASVTALGDAKAAIAISATRRFDLILLDRNLDGADGLDVARAMRAQPRPDGARPRIVGLSALVDDALVDAALAAGMDAFLPKTLRAPDLIARVQALFD